MPSRCHRTRRASAQIAPLVLDLRILLRVVLRQALELLARHARHQLAFVVDLEPRDRQRDRALTDTEEAADVDQRMHLAVLTRLRDAGHLTDLISFARMHALADELLGRQRAADRVGSLLLALTFEIRTLLSRAPFSGALLLLGESFPLALLRRGLRLLPALSKRDLGFRLAHLDFRLGLLDAPLGLRLLDRDFGLGLLDGHLGLGLPHGDLGVRLANRDARLGLLNLDPRLGLLDGHLGFGLTNRDLRILLRDLDLRRGLLDLDLRRCRIDLHLRRGLLHPDIGALVRLPLVALLLGALLLGVLRRALLLLGQREVLLLRGRLLRLPLRRLFRRRLLLLRAARLLRRLRLLQLSAQLLLLLLSLRRRLRLRRLLRLPGLRLRELLALLTLRGGQLLAHLGNDLTAVLIGRRARRAHQLPHLPFRDLVERARLELALELLYVAFAGLLAERGAARAECDREQAAAVRESIHRLAPLASVSAACAIHVPRANARREEPFEFERRRSERSKRESEEPRARAAQSRRAAHRDVTRPR